MFEVFNQRHRYVQDSGVLEEADLVEIGITNKGDRRIILDASSKLPEHPPSGMFTTFCYVSAVSVTVKKPKLGYFCKTKKKQCLGILYAINGFGRNCIFRYFQHAVIMHI